MAIPGEIKTELIRDAILVLSAVTTFITAYIGMAVAKLLQRQKRIEGAAQQTAEKVEHLVTRGVSRETDKPSNQD